MPCSRLSISGEINDKHKKLVRAEIDRKQNRKKDHEVINIFQILPEKENVTRSRDQSGDMRKKKREQSTFKREATTAD